MDSFERQQHLSITKYGNKTQFKWTGNLELLKTFIEEDLKITRRWSRTDNNGGFHTIKAEGASISFYPGTKTLNVQGTKMEIVRKKLFDMKNATDGEVLANHADETVELDSDDNEDEHERGQAVSTTPTVQENVSGASSLPNENGEEPESPPHRHVCPCLIELKKMADQMTELQTKVDSLSAPLQPSYQELKSQIKLLEEERESLLTAIRLLTNESKPMSTPAAAENPVWTLVQPKRKAKRGNEATQRSATDRHPIRENRRSSNTVNTRNTPSKKSVIILGDSMTSNIQGKKLSRGAHVVSKSFSGSTVEDMFDFSKPFTRRKPDEIILHVGTNNLRNEEPQQIAEKIVDLGNAIERETPSTKVTVSSLILRKDDDQLNRKVIKVNNSIRTFCNSKGWDFISNDNIDSDCINRGGLHLNGRGVYKLACNFREHINGN